MDFAKKQLEKYGWTEGKGLGKHEDGISVPLKPKLKFDNTGVGHELGKDFTYKWWENVYNNASNNVEVTTSDGNVKMNLKGLESIEITTKDYSLRDLRKQNNGMEYGTFLKTSKLTQDGVVQFDNVVQPDSAAIPFKVNVLTDEEMFIACGGRTAHKGARHGLKLSGKLSRVEKQERMLLKQLQKVSISDDSTDSKLEKKLKKLKKNQNRPECENKIEEKEDASSIESLCKKKKRKKKRKSVSFNETVTEYHTQDLDTSSQSNESIEPPVILKTQIIDKEREKIEENNDEGIEQDCDAKTEDLGHQSFEQVQKTKKHKKRNTATDRFLQEVNISRETIKRKYDDVDQIETKLISKKKKRKRVEKTINSIAASLDQVCKISDTE